MYMDGMGHGITFLATVLGMKEAATVVFMLVLWVQYILNRRTMNTNVLMSRSLSNRERTAHRTHDFTFILTSQRRGKGNQGFVLSLQGA